MLVMEWMPILKEGGLEAEDTEGEEGKGEVKPRWRWLLGGRSQSGAVLVSCLLGSQLVGCVEGGYIGRIVDVPA